MLCCVHVQAHAHSWDGVRGGRQRLEAIRPFIQKGCALWGLGERAAEAQGWTLWKHDLPMPPTVAPGQHWDQLQASPAGSAGPSRLGGLLTHSHSYAHPAHSHHTCSAHAHISTGSHPHARSHAVMLTRPHTSTLTPTHTLALTLTHTTQHTHALPHTSD